MNQHTFEDLHFEDVGTGISVPGDSDLTVRRGRFVRTDNGVVVRDSPGLMKTLGLPDGTDPHLVLEAIRLLKEIQHMPVEDQKRALSETGLVKALGIGANLAGIYSALIAPQAQELIGTVFLGV